MTESMAMSIYTNNAYSQSVNPMMKNGKLEDYDVKGKGLLVRASDSPSDTSAIAPQFIPTVMVRINLASISGHPIIEKK